MAEEDIAELVEQYIRNLFEIEPKGRGRQTRDEILEYHKQYYIKKQGQDKAVMRVLLLWDHLRGQVRLYATSQEKPEMQAKTSGRQVGTTRG